MTTPTPRKLRGNYRPQRRRAATDKPAFRLTDRDVESVAAVFANRFLTAEIVAQLFPPQESSGPDLTKTGTAAGSNLDRRLRKLFHHNYLDRLRLVVGGELIYALAHEGARKGRTAFFLEADRSTMTLERMVAKYSTYAELYTAREHQHAFGVPTFRVLTVAKSQERASNLLKIVRDAKNAPLADVRGLFYFTSETAYAAEPTNILAARWRAADTPTEERGIIPSPLARR
jgi:hypothetical protein